METLMKSLPYFVLPFLLVGFEECFIILPEFNSGRLYVGVWQDADGNKMINEYVWKGKIGTGSYGKVVRTYNNCKQLANLV